MARTITGTEFHALPNLENWRFVLGRIEATFRAPSFAEAASFLAQVAQAAELAGHHPDLDLRYPGVVRVALMTHANRGLTDLDVDLARTVSALAASGALRSEPLMVSRLEIAIDALDISAVRPFWKAVLAYDDESPTAPGEPVSALVDPLRIGPAVWFQQMDAPRPQRNRIHVDVSVAHDGAATRLAATLAAGGRLINDRFARAFWVLADAEDNEACICTWQDRD